MFLKHVAIEKEKGKDRAREAPAGSGVLDAEAVWSSPCRSFGGAQICARPFGSGGVGSGGVGSGVLGAVDS